jgi:hypothetical protein
VTDKDGKGLFDRPDWKKLDLAKIAMANLNAEKKWSSFFAYIINSSTPEKRSLMASYAIDLIVSNISSKKVAFDIEKFGLQEIGSGFLKKLEQEIKKPVEQTTDLNIGDRINRIFLPGWSTGWDIPFIDSPKDCYNKFLNLFSTEDKNSAKVVIKNQLVDRIVEYYQTDRFGINVIPSIEQTKNEKNGNKKKQLTCMVAPYVDCLWIPASLYMIKDELKKEGITIKFKWMRHDKIGDSIKNGNFDIGIATDDILKKIKRYTKSPLYEKRLSPVALLLPEVLKDLNAKKGIPNIDLYTYMGLLQGRKLVSKGVLKSSRIDLSTTQTEISILTGEDKVKELFFNSEANFLILQAAVSGRGDTVTPSTDGYIWAVESGLISNEKHKQLIGGSGPLIQCEYESNEKDEKEGSLCIIAKSAANEKQITVTALLDHFTINVKKQFTDLASSISRNDDAWSDSAIDLVSILMAPIFEANPFYSGILTKMPPTAFLHNLSNFEKYLDYNPSWWNEFEKWFSKEYRQKRIDKAKIG